MRLLWRVLKGAVSDLAEEPFLWIVYNLLWLALSLPVVTLPFALGGLFYVAREIGERRAVGWRTFFEGGRHYAGPLYRWAALNLIVVVVLIANISFYGRLDQVYSDVLQSLFVSIGCVWLLLQLFVVPVIFRLKPPGLRVALQDGFFLMMRHPGVSLIVALIVITLVSLSILLLILPILATGALIAALCNRVVAEELAQHKTDSTMINQHAHRDR